MDQPAQFLGFRKLLRHSIALANGQLLVLCKSIAAIALYFVRDAAIPAALIFAAYLVSRRSSLASDALAALSGLWFLALAVKYDGAVGYMFAALPLEKSALAIARKSEKNGFGFFANALKTGVLLFFGEMLLICPCFAALNNFIFSPFLMVYEGKSGASAKKRSVEIASGFGYLIFYRTVSFLLITYSFLALATAMIFMRAAAAAIAILALASIYLSLIQSNYVRGVYLETLQLREAGVCGSSLKRSDKSLAITAGFIFILAFLIYAIFKFLPAISAILIKK